MTNIYTAKPREPLFKFDPEQHLYTVDGVRIPSVTEVTGLLDREWFANEYSETGRLIHKLCEYVDLGTYRDDMTDDEDVKAKVRGWMKFKDDLGFEPTFIEQPMYHPRYLYGGQPDRAGFLRKDRYIRDHEAVVEIKSGAVPKLVGLQMVAYEYLFLANHGYGHMPRICVQLLPDDYKRVTFKEKSDWAAFYACLQAKKWQITH